MLGFLVIMSPQKDEPQVLRPSRVFIGHLTVNDSLRCSPTFFFPVAWWCFLCAQLDSFEWTSTIYALFVSELQLKVAPSPANFFGLESEHDRFIFSFYWSSLWRVLVFPSNFSSYCTGPLTTLIIQFIMQPSLCICNKSFCKKKKAPRKELEVLAGEWPSQRETADVFISGANRSWK